MNSLRVIVVLLALLANIDVSAQLDWTVDTAQYNLDASLVVCAKINDVLSIDTSDKIGAFDEDGKCRGIASISYDVVSESYLAYLTVLSSQYGDLLYFKIYDASEDKVYLSSNDPVQFVSNLDLGDIFNPYEIVNLNEGALSLEKNNKVLFTCYPNPVMTHLYFKKSKEIKITKVSVFNSNGQFCIESDFTKDSFYVGDLQPGIYVLMIATELGIIRKEFCKI